MERSALPGHRPGSMFARGGGAVATGRFDGRCIAIVIVLIGTLAVPAIAQEPPPADRIEAVQQRAWVKRGSFALAPVLDAGFNDPFLLRGSAGLRATWWPRSLIGFSLEAGAFAQAPTGASRVAQRELRARMRAGGSGWLTLASVEIAPVDGKVALAGAIVPFEIFLRGGVGLAASRQEFFSEPGAAFAAGLGLRWFALPAMGVEAALVWRSTSVVREIAGREVSDRDVMVAFEVAVPFRPWGAR